MPIGICEDVPVKVANCLILTDFVVLEMTEDDNMSIILADLFLILQGLLLIVIKEKLLLMLMIKNTRCISQRRSIPKLV